MKNRASPSKQKTQQQQQHTLEPHTAPEQQQQQQQSTGVTQRASQVTIPAHVTIKLIGFSILMIVVPLLTYFYSLNMLFIDYESRSTYSAIAAVVSTNLMMLLYVAVAFLEDRGGGGDKKKN